MSLAIAHSALQNSFYPLLSSVMPCIESLPCEYYVGSEIAAFSPLLGFPRPPHGTCFLSPLAILSFSTQLILKKHLLACHLCTIFETAVWFWRGCGLINSRYLSSCLPPASSSSSPKHPVLCASASIVVVPLLPTDYMDLLSPPTNSNSR